MIYPVDFESKIGFDYLRRCVSEKCTCEMGRDEVRKMSFSSDYDFIVNSLRCVNEMMEIISSDVDFPLGNIYDVVPYLNEIRMEGAYMQADRLFKLLKMFVAMDEIASFFRMQKNPDTGVSQYPCLDGEYSGMQLFPLLISAIDRVVNKFGEIKDTASPRLAEIRSSIRYANGSMQRAMQRVMGIAMAQGLVDKDTSPSIRDGRLVIPVAAANKRGIHGIIHDESATGKTVFIEPAEVVEAGNRLRELEMEERREIISILREVANLLRPHLNEMEQSCRLLGKLDFIRAKSRFAIEIGAQMPFIENESMIEWYHAKHPGLFLALKSHNREVVPLNIALGGDKRILIISGPNAGGKSVTLKTTAVVQYMMQCGMMPLLYANSHMGIFKNIFIDIGDEQSFENDLSTYSSHLKNMKFFMQNANPGTLFLADEMGSGTEPIIGGALAQSILKRLGEEKAFGIVTTHYQNLKTFAEETAGFVNGAMLYDRQHFSPTFELSIGNPGSSFAIDIAAKIGLPKDVIDNAKDIAGSDYVNLDKYLSEIARDRRYWANKRQNIKEKEAKLDSLLSKYEESAVDIKSQRKEIISEARKEAKELLDGVNARIERTILEIRKAEAEKERTKKLRQELNEFKADVLDENAGTSKADKLLNKISEHKKRGNRNNNAPTANGKAADESEKQRRKHSLDKGDYVKMKDGNMVGQIISIQGKKCEVAFGAMRTIVAMDKLQSVSKPKVTKNALGETSTISRATMDASRERQLNFKNEIDVRGMRADEAIQAVTYFIDDAIQFSASRVRILHGTGHGILKTLIRQQLKANTAVRTFSDEDVRFGGAGITVVDLE